MRIVRYVHLALRRFCPLYPFCHGLISCLLFPQARTDEYATLTRQYVPPTTLRSFRELALTLPPHHSYYNLATDIYEYGWGQSFHFCRFSVGEPFYQAIARHEHYLAHQIGIKEGEQVLDVGCGVGGPAREIAKFTGANITGLNNNDYQIDRAIYYADKEKLSNQLTYVKGDFMVRVYFRHPAMPSGQQVVVANRTIANALP